MLHIAAHAHLSSKKTNQTGAKKKGLVKALGKRAEDEREII